MDDSFHELEAELKALRPQRPGLRLRENIQGELGTEPAPVARARYASATNLNSWKWLGWRTAGLATAVALVAVLAMVTLKRPMAQTSTKVPPTAPLAATGPARQPEPPMTAHEDRYQPVAAANVLYDLKDEGQVYVDGDTPARRLRYRYLDTYTWKNPRGNASLKWSVPRDEIRVLPASMNLN